MSERNMDSRAEAFELSDQARSQLDAFRARHKTQVLTIFFSDQVESTRQQMDKGNIRAAEKGLAPLNAPPATEKAWPAGTDEVPGEAQRSRAARYRRIAAVVALIAITATALDALAMDPASRAKKAETQAEQEAINARGAEAKARDNLRRANHQLGLAYLERARTLDEQERFTSALLTAAVATGFDGLDSVLGKHYPRLLEPATPTPVQDERLLRPWRLVRPLWRSPSFQHHAAFVSSVSFSPDGKTLASGSRDKTIRLWEVATGKLIATLQGHGRAVTSVSFSPDGQTLASGSADNTIRLWELATGKPIATFEGHGSTVLSVSFSPDGKTLASGSSDKTIRLWQVATGKLIATLEGHGSPTSMSFSPDGKTLASGSSDKTIRLWEVATGKPIATLEGHTDLVFSVSFSPDGKTLASGSLDKTIRLWEVARPWSVPPRELLNFRFNGLIPVRQ